MFVAYFLFDTIISQILSGNYFCSISAKSGCGVTKTPFMHGFHHHSSHHITEHHVYNHINCYNRKYKEYSLFSICRLVHNLNLNY